MASSQRPRAGKVTLIESDKWEGRLVSAVYLQALIRSAALFIRAAMRATWVLHALMSNIVSGK